MNFLIGILITILLLVLDIALKSFYVVKDHILLQYFVIGTCIMILISSIHNLLYSIGIMIIKRRAIKLYKNKEKLSLLKLKMVKERPIAVFVPAWNESSVIDKMVENIIKKAHYNNYMIFVGTYPNDLETQYNVDKVSNLYPNIVKVVTSKDGPTSKSDCLNHVYTAMKEYEIENNIYFDTFVLHDAEDVVHPYEFLVLNYFLLNADAVQMPILPLPTSSKNIVHWIYADEFAIFQMRDSIVREKSGGFVPFAGVGVGITRRAMEKYINHYNTTPFPEHTLTEDYLMSNKMRRLNLKVLFLKITLSDEKNNRKPYSKKEFFISNWAYFPMNFKRSVKQKTRWITGIVFQGWEELQWSKNINILENLVKDRRLLFDQIIVLNSYIVLGYFLLFQISKLFNIEVYDLLGNNKYISVLLFTTMIFMLKDILEKVLIIKSVYGLKQGLLSIPRGFIANIINLFATFGAVKTYYKIKKGKKINWNKTDHLEGVGAIESQKNKSELTNKIKLISKKELDKFFQDEYKNQLLFLEENNISYLKFDNEIKNSIDEYIDSSNWIKRAIVPLILIQFNIDNKTYILKLMSDKNIVVQYNTLEYIYNQNLISKYEPLLNNKNIINLLKLNRSFKKDM